MLEFEDRIPDLMKPIGGPLSGIAPDNYAFWEVWDRIKNYRFKLKWGFFRPSFKLYVLEPVIEKVLGPRPVQ